MILLKAWLVMLLIGVAHSLDGRIPTTGYITTLALVVAAEIALWGVPAKSE